MAGALSVIVHIVLYSFVADVAEQQFAVDIATGHLVFPALFRVNLLAIRAFDAPLDVDVGVLLKAHFFRNNLLSNLNGPKEVFYLNALRILLKVHQSSSHTTTTPAHISKALWALKLTALHKFFFGTVQRAGVLVLVDCDSNLTFRVGTPFCTMLEIKFVEFFFIFLVLLIDYLYL